jgi:hypothetical protein
VGAEEPHTLRFVFYGRTSTEDYQDPASSQCWQRDVAENVIAGRGVIVTEFLDSGYTRRLPWAARPEAAALLKAVRDPDRGFDAIVLGEFERAFYGNQLQMLLPMLSRYEVQLWLPETDGPLDLTNPARAGDVRPTPHRPQRGRDRPRVERQGSALSVPCRSPTEPTPQRRGVEPAHGDGDLDQPAVHGSTGVEPSSTRPRHPPH